MTRRGRTLPRGVAFWALALVIVACGLSGPDTRIEDLETQYQRWLDQRPASYEFELNRRCDCPDEVERPSRILVDGEEVVEARDAETGESLPTTGPRAISVDDIFLHVIDHVGHRDSHISISFDATYNYPTEAHGWVGGALQDEFLYQITEFVPTS